MTTHPGQLNYQKAEVYVGDLLAAIFGDQASRVLRMKLRYQKLCSNA